MSLRSSYPRRAFAWPLIAFLVIIGVVLAGSLVAYTIRPGNGFVFFPFFGFGWGFFFLFLLFFWGMRWWLGWGWGWRGYGRPYGWHQDEAHEILRARYARGEITKDQFDQMTRDLESHARSGP